MKKKGFTLMLAIVSIAIILILSTTIATFALASYRNTLVREKQYELKRKAEDGVEKQIYLLKEYILYHPEVLLNPSSLDISQLKTVKDDDGSLDGMTCQTTVEKNLGEYDRYEDVTTGRKVDYLRIISKAKYTAGNRVATLEVVIDLNSIYNEYFERIFKSSFTTAPKVEQSLGESEFKYSSGELLVSGDMFLQGTVIISPSFPSDFVNFEGDVKVKAPASGFITTITTDLVGDPHNIRMSLYENEEGSTGRSGWKKLQMSKLPLRNILHPVSGSNIDPIQTIVDEDDEINLADIRFIGSDNKLVTYKAEAVGRPIKFQTLINGSDNTGNTEGLYKKIVDIIKSTHPTDWLEHYGEYYKMIMIDGDLDIDDDDYHYYNNYIIYCSGTVKFHGSATFFNSSIFANEIIFEGDSSKKVEFNGINTELSRSHEIAGVELLDFSDDDKKEINYFLIRNLEDYGDYLKFKELYRNEY